MTSNETPPLFQSELDVVGEYDNSTKNDVRLHAALLADFTKRSDDENNTFLHARRNPLGFALRRERFFGDEDLDSFERSLHTHFRVARRQLMDAFLAMADHAPEGARLHESRVNHDLSLRRPQRYNPFWHCDFGPENRRVRILLRLGPDDIQTAVATGCFERITPQTPTEGRFYFDDDLDDSNGEVVVAYNGQIIRIDEDVVHSRWQPFAKKNTRGVLLTQDWVLE